MTTSLRQKAFFRLRAAINSANVIALSRVNGSVVISGYPKTGTTFLSHVAEHATAKRYIEGSMRFALAPSVIHTHSRRGPRGGIFSYRPIDMALPSFVVQRLAEHQGALLARLTASAPSAEDKAQVWSIAQALLTGTPRLPGPRQYYAQARARGGVIVNVLDLEDPKSQACARLRTAWDVSEAKLQSAVSQALQISANRKKQGNEFYNRPTHRVRDIILENTHLRTALDTEAKETRRLVDADWNADCTGEPQ